MMSDPLVSQLLLVGLLWLCLMLYVVWPDDRATAGHTTSLPAKAPRKRSTVPTPFPGLIHKPRCAACEDGVHVHTQAPAGTPPPLIVPTRGRPRQVDTQRHCCPHACWTYYGWTGRGNLQANGHPSGGPWRQFSCTACAGSFLDTHGTPLHGTRVAPEKLVWAVGALAEGLGIRAVARVFEVDPNTVLQWLVEVADHAAVFTQYVLHAVRVTQVQLDELFALLSAVKTGEVSDAEAIQRLSRSPQWVWGALDPVTKLLLTIDVGDRTLAMAQRVVHQVVQVLAPDCAPLFLTDGLREYLTALLTHYGQWVQLPRRQATGPADQRDRLSQDVAALYARHRSRSARSRLDAARGAAVSGAAVASTRGGVSQPWWWEAAREERLRGRRASAWPASRASPGLRGPLGGYESPLVWAFLSLRQSTGEPVVFSRRAQVHDRC